MGRGLAAPYPRNPPPLSAFQAWPVPTPNFFGNVKKHAQRKASADALLCLHYCDVRKSRLASIKCKKPLGRPSSAPDPAGRAYSAPPDPLADGEGAGCPLPKNPIPAFRPHLSPPPNFQLVVKVVMCSRGAEPLRSRRTKILIQCCTQKLHFKQIDFKINIFR